MDHLPRETGCACPPVLISLHQSVVILGNSSCSHSGFIGTALVNLGGFEPTGISLCCSNILDNKRRQMENVHLFQVLSILLLQTFMQKGSISLEVQAQLLVFHLAHVSPFGSSQLMR